MPTHRNALIELQDVCRTYHLGENVVRALAGVSHQFQQGEFWAVMGPSGSGKSTLLNVAGCLDRPTDGQYLLNGQNVGTLDDDELSALRLRTLGFIFQSFNLIPQLTVLRNIELPLFYLGWEAEAGRERARQLADEVGLSDRLHHHPRELSGGQQQRVAIARALANDPLVLLADEPTGNLDTPTGKQIMRMLAELNERGKTIIMVTHEQEIAAYASHHMHMRDGRVASAGESPHA